jgi:hypothetical protein
MRRINLARLLLGGVLAVVLNHLLAWAAWVLFLQRMEAAAGLTYEGPNILGALLAGFVGVGLYVAIRPRFGSGPKTALLAGFLYWFVAGVVPMLLYTFWRGLPLPPALIAISFATTLVLSATGTVVGAWVYEQ